MNRDRQQVKTKQVKIATLMRPKAFGDGYYGALKGAPWDGDKYQGINDQWAYERGRLFAAVYKEPLKDGQRVRYEAQYALSDAIRNGTII